MKSFGIKLLLFLTCLYLVLAGVLFCLWRGGAFDAEPTAGVLPDHKHNQTLVIVGDRDYKPYSFFNSGGAADGFDIELAAELAHRLNMNPHVKLMSWHEALKAMENKEADLIMGIELLVDDANNKAITPTVPISSDTLRVFSHKPVKDPRFLNGLTMAGLEGDSMVHTLNAMDIGVKTRLYPDYTSAMKAVSTGEADFTVIRETIGVRVLKDTGIKNLRPSLALIDNYLCFAVSSDNKAMLDAVNTELERMQCEGFVDELSKKWMDSYLSTLSLHQVCDYNPWLYAVGLALLLLYLLAVNRVFYDRNSQKILSRSLKKDSYYRNALFSDAFAFIECNLSKDTVSGEYTEIVDGVPVPSDYKLGIRAPYTFSELVDWWFDKLYVGSETPLEPEGMRERLLSRFAAGERTVTFVCSAKTPTLEHQFQQITIYMALDTSSSDVIGMCVVKDITGEQNQKTFLEMSRKINQALARNYMQIYYVNLPNNSVTLKDGSISAYPPVFREYVEEVAMPEYVNQLMNADTPEGIERLMGQNENFLIVFKNKEGKYCTLRGVRTGESENTVVLGFAEKDKELRDIMENKEA
ncbi:MAG: transporter substrate-binding domain-containing protein [Abditibacteriota bacterium]|nr:transporter substrate-binding domain-containing protein [Abditibacteriota bacterium]